MEVSQSCRRSSNTADHIVHLDCEVEGIQLGVAGCSVGVNFGVLVASDGLVIN